MWYQQFGDDDRRPTSVTDQSEDGAKEAADDAAGWSRDGEDDRPWELVWLED